MLGQTTIFDDADYTNLRELISQIKSVDEALALLENINAVYQLSQWTVVDIIHHFQQNHPSLIPQLEVGLEMVLNYDRSQISQLKKVASVFGDVSLRFPALSFTAHVHLAYATAYLDWSDIVRVAKEAEINAWSVKEIRLKLEQLRREKLIAQAQAQAQTQAQAQPQETQETPRRRGRPPAVEVDLKEEVKLREQANEEEKKRTMIDIAIRAADAYMRFGREFIPYLLEALTVRQWEFFWNIVVEMRRRIPMLAASQIEKAVICTSLSELLDDLLYVSESGNKMGNGRDETGEETESI